MPGLVGGFAAASPGLECVYRVCSVHMHLWHSTVCVACPGVQQSSCHEYKVAGFLEPRLKRLLPVLVCTCIHMYNAHVDCNSWANVDVQLQVWHSNVLLLGQLKNAEPSAQGVCPEGMCLCTPGASLAQTVCTGLLLSAYVFSALLTLMLACLPQCEPIDSHRFGLT
jgi:hypothetical protein